MGRPYRILLIAEAANPEWASVPLIGWSLSRALSKIANVHLVTHVRNRDAILRFGLVEGRDFTSIDNELFASPLFKMSSLLRGGTGKGWTTGTAFSAFAYYSFELAIWRQFRNRLVGREFDLVHRITPLSPTSPSIIAKRSAKLGVPFVIGPLNGGVPWPRQFAARQRAEREWLSYIRWLYRLMPGYRSTRRYSAAIIVGSKHTYSEMPTWAQSKCVYIPENGVELGSRVRASHPGCLRAAFVGRLVPYKGADMLLDAVADFLRNGTLELDIIGDGPQRPILEQMVHTLGQSDHVIFHGWLPHAEVQRRLQQCDFMVLPSIREFGGGVVIEAMALEVPPIVADYAGPAELVDDTTGFRVPFHDKESLVANLKSTISEVLRSPETLDGLGKAGRKKVQENFTWQAKAKQILAVYEAVLTGSIHLQSLGLSE